MLAISENRENVYLNPHELKQSGADVPGLSACLGKILQKDAAWIEAQAGDLKKRYKQVGTNISEHQLPCSRLAPMTLRQLLVSPSTSTASGWIATISL